MEALLYCACGLDIHKEIIEACILRGLDAEPEVIRRSFGTTKDRGRFSVLIKTKAKDTEPSSVLTTHSYEDWLETLYEQYFAFWEWFT